MFFRRAARAVAGDCFYQWPAYSHLWCSRQAVYSSSIEARIEETGRADGAGVLRAKLRELEPQLSRRERYSVLHRMLVEEPETLLEIGRRFGVSRERVPRCRASSACC